MNNKKRGQKERKRKGVIDEASADTATNWLAAVLLHQRRDTTEMCCL